MILEDDETNSPSIEAAVVSPSIDAAIESTNEVNKLTGPFK